MRRLLLALAALSLASPALAQDNEIARWTRHADAVTITRDDWGVAHVHGKTDADAVFGMIYAQAEDDFGRIEMNYLTALGRVSEAQGEAYVAQDLRARLYVDPVDLKQRFDGSPGWLKGLMTAWADGLNDYLALHPRVSPKVITHFEPWMALAFSEGSIGGDIERIELGPLADFYAQPRVAMLERDQAERALLPTGSNGIAIAPANAIGRHALLLINPHTSYYFRSELQMTSDTGLNAYGAATWGQFFLYQGFNDRLGWMHTTSRADTVDRFIETVVRKDGRLFYRYGKALRPIERQAVTIRWRTASGGLAAKTFTVLKTHHGPVVAAVDADHWISEAMMFKPVEAIEQGFGLTRAHDFAGYMKVMELKANTSNNTVYADADGNIAYLHPQFIPRRDNRFDYRQPVDGADPDTDWKGLHALNEAPRLLNPPIGWIQNTNDWPYSAAGPDSPKRGAFPGYMDTYGENVRGLHAVALLTDRHDFTLEGLAAAAFDSDQPGFRILLPALFKAYNDAAPDDPLRAKLADQIALLQAWDMRWGPDSVPTSLAVYWGEALWETARRPRAANSLVDYAVALTVTSSAQKLRALADASDRLTADFGSWRTPWGRINRFQRRTDDLVQTYADSAPSLPIPFTSGQWGSLASATGPKPDGEVKRRYADTGNSFVAVVEFGPRLRAMAVNTGGESGNRYSPHFRDQADRFTTGKLREVYFYPDQLVGHTERTYHPGG